MSDEAQWVCNYICCVDFVIHVVYYLLNMGTPVHCTVLIIGQTQSQAFLTHVLGMRK